MVLDLLTQITLLSIFLYFLQKFSMALLIVMEESALVFLYSDQKAYKKTLQGSVEETRV